MEIFVRVTGAGHYQTFKALERDKGTEVICYAQSGPRWLSWFSKSKNTYAYKGVLRINDKSETPNIFKKISICPDIILVSKRKSEKLRASFANEGCSLALGRTLSDDSAYFGFGFNPDDYDKNSKLEWSGWCVYGKDTPTIVLQAFTELSGERK